MACEILSCFSFCYVILLFLGVVTSHFPSNYDKRLRPLFMGEFLILSFKLKVEKFASSDPLIKIRHNADLFISRLNMEAFILFYVKNIS